RSTVGTITEIHDYLRVLYARIGQGHCPECGRAITAQTREQILSRIMALPAGTRFLVLAPVIRGQKGEYKDLFEDMLKRGFVRARVDGQIVRLSDNLQLDRRIKHNIEIVIDRLKMEDQGSQIEDREAKAGSNLRSRASEAVEQALALGQGNLILAIEIPMHLSESRSETETKSAKPRSSRLDPGSSHAAETQSTYEDLLLSAHYACTHCDKSYEPPTPQLFS